MDEGRFGWMDQLQTAARHLPEDELADLVHAIRIKLEAGQDVALARTIERRGVKRFAEGYPKLVSVLEKRFAANWRTATRAGIARIAQRKAPRTGWDKELARLLRQISPLRLLVLQIRFWRRILKIWWRRRVVRIAKHLSVRSLSAATELTRQVAEIWRKK